MFWKGYIANSVHFLFAFYTLMLFAYIISSWFPSFKNHKIMRFVAHYTEPYLQIFRKIIPPIGGILDLSPIIGFFVLRFLEPICIKIILRFF